MTRIYLAATRGFCAGVERAVNIVRLALERYGPGRVWVLHEVVHNRRVVADLASKGALFVESLDEIPDHAVTVFSAHGVGLATVTGAQVKGLHVIDATCPLVARVHRKMNAAGREGKSAVVIGHKGHREVAGTIGQYQGDPNLVHVVMTPEDVAALNITTKQAVFATQTTLSVDETLKTVQALREKFPGIEGPRSDDTCYATQDRQAAVKDLAAVCDVILVAGSPNSSNSNRLREVAESEGVPAYLVDDYTMIREEYLKGAENIGLSAGASAPAEVVDGIIEFLEHRYGVSEIIELGSPPRSVSFPLPKGLLEN